MQQEGERCVWKGYACGKLYTLYTLSLFPNRSLVWSTVTIYWTTSNCAKTGLHLLPHLRNMRRVGYDHQSVTCMPLQMISLLILHNIDCSSLESISGGGLLLLGNPELCCVGNLSYRQSKTGLWSLTGNEANITLRANTINKYMYLYYTVEWSRKTRHMEPISCETGSYNITYKKMTVNIGTRIKLSLVELENVV